MCGHHFDISYFEDNIVSQKEYDEFFKEFGDKFEWHASESVPSSDPAKRGYHINAYQQITDFDALKRLCEKVKVHDKFFLEILGRDGLPTMIYSYNRDFEVLESYLNEQDLVLRNILTDVRSNNPIAEIRSSENEMVNVKEEFIGGYVCVPTPGWYENIPILDW